MKHILLKTARKVRWFAEHPVTRLALGCVLFLTAVYEIEEGLLIELGEQGPQAHHGIAAFGVLTIIAALPDLLDGLVAGTEYVERYR